MDAQGREVAPLSEADLERAIAAIAAQGAEAVAICFLFAHLNPEHERRAAAQLRAALPDVPLSLSHVVDPAPREYDRTVAVSLDAWVSAILGPQIAELRAALLPQFSGDLLFGDGRGVLVPAARFDTQRAQLLGGRLRLRHAPPQRWPIQPARFWRSISVRTAPI